VLNQPSRELSSINARRSSKIPNQNSQASAALSSFSLVDCSAVRRRTLKHMVRTDLRGGMSLGEGSKTEFSFNKPLECYLSAQATK